MRGVLFVVELINLVVTAARSCAGSMALAFPHELGLVGLLAALVLLALVLLVVLLGLALLFVAFALGLLILDLVNDLRDGIVGCLRHRGAQLLQQLLAK